MLFINIKSHAYLIILYLVIKIYLTNFKYIIQTPMCYEKNYLPIHYVICWSNNFCKKYRSTFIRS